MSWESRIADAAYTSPTGVRFTFDFEDVSRSTEKKHTVFTYPQKSGAYVQDLLQGVRRFPLKIFIHGLNYDIEADAFYAALEEPGFGTLEHPFYGTFTVYPTTVSRADALKTAGGQAVFDVEFVENSLDPSPLSSSDERTIISETVDDLSLQGAIDIEETMEGRSPTAFQKFSDSLKQINEFTTQYVRPVMVAAGIDTGVFDNVSQGLRFIGNVNEDNVREVSAQLNSLIRSGESATRGGPGAYIDLADALVGMGYDGEEQFSIIDYAAKSTVGALTVSTGNTEYETRQDAVNDAEAVVSTYETVVDWGETNV